MPLKKIILTLLAFLGAGTVFAQTDVLSVVDALEYAYEHNARLNQTRELLNQKKAEQKLIYGLNNPTFNYAKEGVQGTAFTEQRWVISQTLDFPTTIINRNSRVDKEFEALEASYEAAKLSLKVRVKSAYTNLAYALEIVRLRDEQVRLAREIESLSLERNRVGETSKMDVLQAQLQLSQASNNHSDALNALQNARYNLFNTIGLSSSDQSYETEFPDTLVYVSVEFDQQTVLDAISRHPLIYRDQYNIQAAESRLNVSRSRYLPSILGSYFWQDFGNGYDFTGFEVGISIPLWFGFNQKPQVGMSKALLRSQEYKLQQDILALKTQAEQAWHSFENAEGQIKEFNENIRERSSELLALTREAYRVGQIPLITVLQAQRTYLQSQERYLTSLRDYYIHLINIEQFLQTDLIYAD